MSIDPWRRFRILADTAANDVYGDIKPGNALPQSYINNAQAISKFLVAYAGEMLADVLVYALTGTQPKNRYLDSLHLSVPLMWHKHHQYQNQTVRVLRRATSRPLPGQ